DEYTINFTKQLGEKGAPLNIYNNPPVPPNSFWRWPYWDVQDVSFHTSNRLGPNAYLKTRTYYNTFENGLNAYDDITYTTQSLPGRFFSPYDDHAAGTSLEFGSTRFKADTIKIALYLRTDVHEEQQTSRPTNPNPALRSTEPVQKQSENTWSLAAENTYRVNDRLDWVAGISYDDYTVTRAQDYNAARGLFEYPRGGANAFNWQTALLWRGSATTRYHFSISDRARFPTFFELYSTRFGTATPNPDLGAERATNVELGWERTGPKLTRAGGAVFYSDVQDLIQTVVLPDTTTQSQNVGNGSFYGVEAFLEARPSDRLIAGGNFTHIHRRITDALQPNLRPTGVPDNKLVLYATWRPNRGLAVTPSVEATDDRWSDMTTNPVQAFPYVETGAHTLLNFDVTYRLKRGLEVAAGFKNLLDENYELAWGYPEVGRTMYAKFRIAF
ncbi:MAG TPA: TonB-dependent receptor, partial [Gammaproteobacteria bacterium]|nr:TonB-dependent receptor [Gammaproteobacteria bacterium]